MNSIKFADLEHLRFLAWEYQKQGNIMVAQQVYEVLLDLETAVFGTESGGVALCLYKLAELKFAQHENVEGRELMMQAVAVWDKSYPSDYLSLLSYTEALEKIRAERPQMPKNKISETRRAA